MRWVSSVSTASSLDDAIEETCDQIKSGFIAENPDLLFVFISPHHMPSYYSLLGLLEKRLGSRIVIGCSAAGVFGGGRQLIQRPGISLMAGALDGINLEPVFFSEKDLPDADSAPEAWHALLNSEPETLESLLLLIDPFSVRVDPLLAGLDFAFPKTDKFGGLVSGGTAPGENALFIDDELMRGGVVGLKMKGNISIDTTIFEYCRPLGRPMLVSESRENLVLKLNGELPLTIIRELFNTSNKATQKLIQRSLQVGVLNENLSNDFESKYLIRNVLGVDKLDGSLTVGETVREGQVVQFYLHDPELASKDFLIQVDDYIETSRALPSAALLFSSVARQNHSSAYESKDLSYLGKKLIDVPITGFLSNGEISSLNGQTLLNGYTNTIAMLHGRSDVDVKKKQNWLADQAA